MQLAVITKNRSNPAYAAARMGAERVAASLGASVTQWVPERPDDAAQQAALIDAAVASTPDAIVIAPVSDARVDAALARAHARGIALCGFVNRSAAAPLVAFAGADDLRLAREIAATLLAAMQHRGELLLVEGPRASDTSEARTRGFLEALSRHPQLRIAARCSGEYQLETARSVVAGLLPQLPVLDGVLCANDVMALGALQALSAAGRRSRVVGVNAIPEAVAAVGRGELLATADFNAMWMCALATECAIRHRRGAAVPAEIMLPVRIVDAGNWREWDLPYQQRALPPLDATLRLLVAAGGNSGAGSGALAGTVQPML